jgi:RES domain-containing protein
MAQFTSFDDYRKFANEIKHARYIHSPRVSQFLDAVRQMAKERVFELKKGDNFRLWRAQKGHRSGFRPYTAARMKPQSGKAVEGRVNPKGLPCLYVASDPNTAVAETRPWKDEIVSVAELNITRDVTLVECHSFHEHTGVSTLLKLPMSSFDNRGIKRGVKIPYEHIKDDVWTRIDKSFSEPTTRTDDLADYVPTQVIAEAFKNERYDGVVYKSQLSEKGVNIAFFNPAVAKVIDIMLYKVTDIKIEAKRCDESYRL